MNTDFDSVCQQFDDKKKEYAQRILDTYQNPFRTNVKNILEIQQPLECVDLNNPCMVQKVISFTYSNSGIDLYKVQAPDNKTSGRLYIPTLTVIEKLFSKVVEPYKKAKDYRFVSSLKYPNIVYSKLDNDCASPFVYLVPIDILDEGFLTNLYSYIVDKIPWNLKIALIEPVLYLWDSIEDIIRKKDSPSFENDYHTLFDLEYQNSACNFMCAWESYVKQSRGGIYTNVSKFIAEHGTKVAPPSTTPEIVMNYKSRKGYFWCKKGPDDIKNLCFDCTGKVLDTLTIMKELPDVNALEEYINKDDNSNIVQISADVDADIVLNTTQEETEELCAKEESNSICDPRISFINDAIGAMKIAVNVQLEEFRKTNIADAQTIQDLKEELAQKDEEIAKLKQKLAKAPRINKHSTILSPSAKAVLSKRINITQGDLGNVKSILVAAMRNYGYKHASPDLKTDSERIKYGYSVIYNYFSEFIGFDIWQAFDVYKYIIDKNAQDIEFITDSWLINQFISIFTQDNEYWKCFIYGCNEVYKLNESADSGYYTSELMANAILSFVTHDTGFQYTYSQEDYATWHKMYLDEVNEQNDLTQCLEESREAIINTPETYYHERKKK